MADWFSFQDFKQKKKMRGKRGLGKRELGIAPTKDIKRSFKDDKGAYELRVSYIPEGMWYREISAKVAKKDMQVYTLEMPDSGVILEPGEPMLPIEGLFIALPSGAELGDIKVVDSESFEFPGELNIIAAPEPTKDGGIEYDRKEPEFNPNKNIYGKDTEFPKELFKLIGVNYVGSVRVAHLMMYPLHYKPKSKRLIIYDRIELVIEYTPGLSIPKMRAPPAAGAPSEKAPPDMAMPAPVQMQMELQDQLLNLDAIEDLRTRADGATRRVIQPVTRGQLSQIENKGQYLIVTTENLVEAMKSLAKSKEKQGMTTKIVTDKQIYEEFQESGEPKFKSIRDFVLYAYDNWEDPPEYVLLVGEIGKIPTHHNPEFDCPSDWYYSNLIGDIGPDLVIGRIAINEPEKLKKYVNKILAYENAKGDWVKRILFTAFERYDYMQCSDDCIEIMKKVRGAKIIKKYGGQATKEELVKEIDDGCGIINYRGHGSEWEWQSSNGIGVNDTGKLKNKEKNSIIFSICCLNNAIDVSAECFGESFIEAANGAVAFVGASRPSYTQTNHHFDRFIFRAIVDKGLRIVGKIFNYATIELFRNFPDVYTKENVAMYLLLGDPSLKIKFPN